MSSRIHPVIILILVTCVGLVFGNLPKPPYQAQVINKDVNIYSSPSTTDSYVCGKVSESDTVTVVRTQGRWSKIMPVEGCFSWISIEYVDLDKNMPSIGMVTGNSVRVWAGSENLSPLRSKKSQTYLNKGELVTLLGPIKDEYYKIVPPVGAYLWVKNDDIKYVEAVNPKPVKPSEFKPVIPPTPVEAEQSKVVQIKPTIDQPSPLIQKEAAKPTIVVPKTTKPAVDAKPVTKPEPVKPNPALRNIDNGSITFQPVEVKPEEVAPVVAIPVEKPVVVTPKPVVPVSTEATRLKECYAIKDLLDAERQKPIEEQNYEPIKKQIQEVMNDAKAGKAIKYAEYEMSLAERYEYAVKVNNQLKGQEENLDDNLKQIKANYIARTATIPKTAQYTVVGVIRKSQIYNEQHSQQRYTIADETGKIVCYALADTGAARSIANSLEGKKVGLKGSVTKDPNNAITVVRFTQINELP